MTIRPAEPGDAGEVVALVRQSFRPQDLDLTIYGCAGIAAYLEMEFALPRALSASAYLVAAIEGRIAGFADMRATDTGICLNYIATSPDWRGIGVGRELLAAALRAIDPPAGSLFTLEVFEHNQAALDWYRRSGFHRLGRMAFWRVADGGAPAGHVRVVDLPQADVTHRAFGFSSFRLAHGGRTFTIGRLGERWFRVTEGELLRRPEALRALQSLDPRREILFHGAGETASLSSLLWSIRMGRQL
jgi:ribosomal protein S18 acetylase RimI-like enzyme